MEVAVLPPPPWRRPSLSFVFLLLVLSLKSIYNFFWFFLFFWVSFYISLFGLDFPQIWWMKDLGLWLVASFWVVYALLFRSEVGGLSRWLVVVFGFGGGVLEYNDWVWWFKWSEMVAGVARWWKMLNLLRWTQRVWVNKSLSSDLTMDLWFWVFSCWAPMSLSLAIHESRLWQPLILARGSSIYGGCCRSNRATLVVVCSSHDISSVLLPGLMCPISHIRSVVPFSRVAALVAFKASFLMMLLADSSVVRVNDVVASRTSSKSGPYNIMLLRLCNHVVIVYFLFVIIWSMFL